MEAILIVGIIQSLLGSVLIFIFRKKHLANRILSYWLIVILAIMFEALIKEYSHQYAQNALQSSSVLFIFGPMLYFYTRSLITEQPKLTTKDALHFVPFMVFSCLLIFVQKTYLPSHVNWFSSGPLLAFRLIFTGSLIFSLTAYSSVVLFKIRKHYINIKHQFSYNSERVNLAWLALFSFFFLSGYMVSLLIVIFKVKHQEEEYSVLEIYYAILTLFSYGISLFGYRQPILYGKVAAIEPQGERNESKPIVKYEKSGLKSDDANNYLTILMQYMEKEMPYLQGELALQDISLALDIPKHYLTQIINEKLGKNFYNFVNEYRVDEFKKRIVDPKNSNLTLLGIAMDCGFNSKSSFNAIFKQITGKTPTQYKKEIGGEQN
jgi:AraC-like DNA-binding protein